MNSLLFRQAPVQHTNIDLYAYWHIGVYLCVASIGELMFSLLPHPDPRPNLNLPPGSIMQLSSMNAPLCHQTIAILSHCTGQFTSEGIIEGEFPAMKLTYILPLPTCTTSARNRGAYTYFTQSQLCTSRAVSSQLHKIQNLLLISNDCIYFTCAHML